MKKLTILIFVVCVTLILTACAPKVETQVEATPPAPATAVIAEGNIRPSEAVNLAFQARGTVDEILVRQGDAVRKGDVLARLSNYKQAAAQLAAAQLELTQAQQAFDTLNRTADLDRARAWDVYQKAQKTRADAQKEWDDLNLRDIQDRIDDQQANVNDRKKDLEDAQDEFDRYKDLESDNSKRKTAEDKLRNEQKDYDSAVAELEKIQRERDSVRAALDAALSSEAEAKHQYELTANGPNADQLALAQSRLDNAKAQVAAAQSALDNYELKSPFDGVLADVSIDPGEQVGPEKAAVSVANFSEWIVETTDVTELEVVKLAVGQKVTMVPDALPNVELTGVVTEISQAYKQQGGDILYTVRIKVDEVDPLVRWGMTVQATFKPLEK